MSRLSSIALAFAIAACAPTSEPAASADPAPRIVHRTAKPSDDVLHKELTHVQYEVTQHDDTEVPFHNEYFDNHAAGIYVDVVTGEPLFSSTEKFDSGTGWPSFWRPITGTTLAEKHDDTHGMDRVEVRSKLGDSHLGHVFTDGPPPTGLRYCINSASLRFVPVDQLDAQGYGPLKALFAKR